MCRYGRRPPRNHKRARNVRPKPEHGPHRNVTRPPGLVELRGLEPLTPSMRTEPAGRQGHCPAAFLHVRDVQPGTVTPSYRAWKRPAAPVLLPESDTTPCALPSAKAGRPEPSGIPDAGPRVAIQDPSAASHHDDSVITESDPVSRSLHQRPNTGGRLLRRRCPAGHGSGGSCQGLGCGES
jgi:hypothetical protein